MLFSMMLAMAVAEPIDCPPAGASAGEICADEPKAPPKGPKPFVARPLSAAEKAEIMREADKVLFDGPSARWQWGPRLDDYVFCGQVNARNRLGAYVGWRPFYYTSRGSLRIIADGDSTIAYKALCSNAGYIPKP